MSCLLETLTAHREGRLTGRAAWYAATMARLGARVALEQAEEFRRVLEDLGERLGK
jgi:hypothetical protein